MPQATHVRPNPASAACRDDLSAWDPCHTDFLNRFNRLEDQDLDMARVQSESVGAMKGGMDDAEWLQACMKTSSDHEYAGQTTGRYLVDQALSAYVECSQAPVDRSLMKRHVAYARGVIRRYQRDPSIMSAADVDMVFATHANIMSAMSMRDMPWLMACRPSSLAPCHHLVRVMGDAWVCDHWSDLHDAASMSDDGVALGMDATSTLLHGGVTSTRYGKPIPMGVCVPSRCLRDAESSVRRGDHDAYDRLWVLASACSDHRIKHLCGSLREASNVRIYPSADLAMHDLSRDPNVTMGFTATSMVMEAVRTDRRFTDRWHHLLDGIGHRCDANTIATASRHDYRLMRWYHPSPDTDHPVPWGSWNRTQRRKVWSMLMQQPWFPSMTIRDLHRSILPYHGMTTPFRTERSAMPMASWMHNDLRRVDGLMAIGVPSDAITCWAMQDSHIAPSIIHAALSRNQE
jgi:hypothetical protein